MEGEQGNKNKPNFAHKQLKADVSKLQKIRAIISRVKHASDENLV